MSHRIDPLPPLPRPGRRRLLAPVLLAIALAGCVTVVRPPPAPLDPVEVYLLDHGRTPSLVVPAGDADFTRWAYGDWRWYALGERGIVEAVAALFWPTQAGLGRQELAASPEAPAAFVTPPTQRAPEVLEAPPALQAPAFLEMLSVPIEELYPIRVERRQVAALAARLDRLFRLRSDTLEASEDSGLDFVHHPVPYTLFHNSNRVVADWLRELGCEVRGRAILSRWRLLPPARLPAEDIDRAGAAGAAKAAPAGAAPPRSPASPGTSAGS